MQNLHLYKLTVDNVDRTERGFICACAEFGVPDYTERFITNAELLAHLGADKDGDIPCMRHKAYQVWDGEFHAWREEWDDQEYTISFDQWLEDKAGIDLEIELSLLINKAEDRTISAPLPNGLNALNNLLSLNKNAA